MPFKNVFVTALTDTWLVADADRIADKPGDLRFEQDATYGMLMYKCVILQNDTATVAVAAGDAVNYLATTGLTTHTVVADVDDAGTQRLCAGVIVASAIAGVADTAYYCWVQIQGACLLNTAIGGTPGDGDPLTTDGAADKAMDKAATIENRCAALLDATTRLVSLRCHW
jgi:hypothetical protein